MKIAIIGAGAMGQLFGAKLSEYNAVTLIARRESLCELIRKNGVAVEENGEVKIYHPSITTHPNECMDLVIVFTKALDAEKAMGMYQNIIDEHTFVLSLMNGAGHKLPDGALVGVTQDGAYKKEENYIVHSGVGQTFFGRPDGATDGLSEIEQVFVQAGFDTAVSDNIQYIVWNKLMINASSSVLSGVLGVRQGIVYTNPYAWSICQNLIREICQVASAAGVYFNEDEQITRIQNHLIKNPNGFTSIYADLKNGRKTEVDYINGTVYQTGLKYGIEANTHKLMINMVHAMETITER